MSKEYTKGPWRVEEGTTLIWGDCNPEDTSSYGMGYPSLNAVLLRQVRGQRVRRSTKKLRQMLALSPPLLIFLRRSKAPPIFSEGCIAHRTKTMTSPLNSGRFTLHDGH